MLGWHNTLASFIFAYRLLVLLLPLLILLLQRDFTWASSKQIRVPTSFTLQLLRVYSIAVSSFSSYVKHVQN